MPALEGRSCFDEMTNFYHILPSVSLFFGGLIILLCKKLWEMHTNVTEFKYHVKIVRMSKMRRRFLLYLTFVKNWVQALLSAKTKAGRILMCADLQTNNFAENGHQFFPSAPRCKRFFHTNTVSMPMKSFSSM